MHISEQDLNKITDALISAQNALTPAASVDEKASAQAAVIVAQSFIVNAKDERADGALREAALDRVMNEFNATDEIEIDDDAGTSQSDKGTWVQAWVFVPNAEDEECGQCEGTGTTDAMGHSEECPVCDGSGQLASASL